ncbi:MAG: hypothetical protein ACXW3D_06555 [Caulobacteraceae bacterium]
MYFDESYDDQQPPILCVAGYLFRKRKAVDFSRKWGGYLKRRGLPYFHMSECAHGTGIFSARTDCVEVQTELIRLTRMYSEVGIAISVDESAYNEHCASLTFMPRTAYGFALLECTSKVGQWADTANFQGKAAYFFEDGYRHKSDAHEYLTWVFDHEKHRERCRYGSMHFVGKETPGLHPADFFAWQWRKELKLRHQLNRRVGMRKDFDAIVRDGDIAIHWNESNLAPLAAELEAAEVSFYDRRERALNAGLSPPRESKLAPQRLRRRR